MARNKPKGVAAGKHATSSSLQQSAPVLGIVLSLVVAVCYHALVPRAPDAIAPGAALELTDEVDTPPPEDDGAVALQRILSSVPDNACVSWQQTAEAAFESGNTLKRQGKWVGAVSCYKAALRLDARHVSSYNNMGNTLKRLDNGALQCDDAPCPRGDVKNAAKHSLRTVIALNPRHANAYTNLASIMRSTGHLTESIELNRWAVTIEPRHATAYENMGRALQAGSAPAGAVNTVAAAAATADIDPAATAASSASQREGAWISSTHGGVRHRGRLEQAVAAYEAVLALHGQRASADARRGAAYANLWLGRETAHADTLAVGFAAGMWTTPGQTPGVFDPSLPSAAFPPTDQVSCIPRMLESRGSALAAEATQLLARSALRERRTGHVADGGWDAGHFTKEVEGLHTPRDGFAFYDLLAHCPVPETRALHTELCDAIDELQLVARGQLELARISRLQAGVSISSHTGLHNRRWRCHLGLKLARSHGARLVVAGTPVAWKVGEAFIFDDSFEHSVAWDDASAPVDLAPDEARLVLIVDFLHPQLAGDTCSSAPGW